MITPVILCGGSGTRLWPLSRASYPKQFSSITGDKSLFQASAQRFPVDRFSRPIVVTSADFRFIVAEQLGSVGIEPSAILIEPEPKNTAPAILAAALFLQESDPNGMMLVAPSDHVVSDNEAFWAAVDCGVEAASNGDLVTFGIRPNRPETGYGYLELAVRECGGRPVKLKRFIEKPTASRAAEMLEAGNYLWNAGIFLFQVSSVIAAFEAHAPNLIEPVRRATSDSELDLGFRRLDWEPWSKADNISIDYAVMEKSSNLTVVPFEHGWSDLGDWDAVLREGQADENGVVSYGQVTTLGCRDTLLRSEAESLEVVGIGLENIVVVALPDAVLVADRTHTQTVKSAVSALLQKGSKQATQFPREHRPWGWFDILVLAGRYQVKRIVVKPGASLSLQSHFHRSEHWIVVTGTAKVIVDDDSSLLTENQSIHVPLGAIHRLENPGKINLEMIEVQTGAYLEEDDIVRYGDAYSRKTDRP